MRVASLVNNHVAYASIFVDSRVFIGVCGCEISPGCGRATANIIAFPAIPP
jgi:hypothetical protein